MITPTLTAARLRQAPICVVDFAEAGPPRLFEHPQESGFAWHCQQVAPLLRQAEKCSRAGLWVVVVVGYEAAAAFALPVVQGGRRSTPLAWYGAFSNESFFSYPSPSPSCHYSLKPPVSRLGYQIKLQEIHAALLAGESYQVNYTLPHTLAAVDGEELFLQLQVAGRYPFSAWLAIPLPDGNLWRLSSLSPELFIQRRGETLVSAPIKGTRRRGGGIEEEVALRHELISSEKERAEHIMIVDMVRNDLGRICQIGSVHVPRLMETRLFQSLLHLESRVEGKIKSGMDLADIFVALFPAASVTGAPKHQTMKIISRLEAVRRGVYTGAIGLLEPGGDFTFNVAIRTLEWRGKGGGRLGLGGGIVADSQWQREWQELAEKGAFLTHVPPPFHLFETLLWQGEGGYLWLEDHLQRMADSARQLAFPFNRQQAEELLLKEVASSESCVIRLNLHGDGRFTLQRRPIPPEKSQLCIKLSPLALDRLSPLSRHKNSRRQLLDDSLHEAEGGGYDDVLFLNGDGHVACGSIRAIMARINGRWVAPPLSCGILPSLWRKHELSRLQGQEEAITLQQLLQAEEIRMGNSVRGGQRVVKLVGLRGEVLWEAE